MRGWLVPVLFLIVAFAGCAGDSPDAQRETPGPIASGEELGVEEAPQSSGEPGSSTEPSQTGEPSSGRPISEPTTAPPSTTSANGEPAPEPPQPIPGGTMLATVSAEHPVAGYTLTIPEGTKTTWCDGCSFYDVYLAVAPVGDLPEAMTVAFFDLEDGSLIYGRTFTEVEGDVYLTAAVTSPIDNSRAFDPTMVRLDEDLDGQTIGVVVAATGLDSVAGVMIHPDDSYDRFEDDTRDVSYLEQQGVWTPWAIGTGTEHAFGYYSEISVGLYAPVGLSGWMLWAGEPLLTSTGPWVHPHGGQRTASIQSPTPLGGYTFAGVSALSGEGAMDWSVQATAGAAAYEDSGVMTWGRGYGYLATAIVLGLPFATAQGAGDVSVRHDQTAVSTGDFYFLDGAYISFDATLETLLGIPDPQTAEGFGGLLRTMDELQDPTDIVYGDATLSFGPPIDIPEA